MATTIEILPPERGPVTPVAPPPPSVTIIDAPSTARGDRRDARNDRGTSFRAVLDAATFKGVIASAPAGRATYNPQRPEKFPGTGADELSSGDSTGLLDAMQATAGTDARPTAEQEAHRAAVQRYARTFFSDTRTFARPGESLEISA